jgi:hypothetical protein
VLELEMFQPQAVTIQEEENRVLKEKNAFLLEQNAQLQSELTYLKGHPVILAGIKGETLVCDLVAGRLTSFARSYDIKAGKHRIEVKYSNLGRAERKKPKTLRWSWSKPLGWKDKGKNYDYLVLIGEKDYRFPDQYLDDTPYVCFFIARDDVESLAYKGTSIGGIVQITTNFKAVGSPKAKQLLLRLARLEDVSALMAAGAPHSSRYPRIPEAS